MFGEFVKKKRFESKLTLRDFCIKSNVDVCLWSDIEEEFKRPNFDEETLSTIANVLSIDIHSEDYKALKNYAIEDSQKSPVSTKMKGYPLYVRVDNRKPTRNELKKVLSCIHS